MYLNKAVRSVHDAIAKGLMDNKLLLKGGWEIYRVQAVPVDASHFELREIEQAYWAGAQHLMACIMVGLDPGTEPTDDDLKRMDYIEQELEEFANRLAARTAPKPKGSA